MGIRLENPFQHRQVRSNPYQHQADTTHHHYYIHGKELAITTKAKYLEVNIANNRGTIIKYVDCICQRKLITLRLSYKEIYHLEQPG